MEAYTIKRTCNYSERVSYYAGQAPLEFDGMSLHLDYGTRPVWTKDVLHAAWSGDRDQVEVEADMWQDYSRTHDNQYRYEVHAVPA